MRKLLSIIIALCCAALVIAVQYYLRNYYNNIFTQTLPSFIATIGGYFIFSMWSNPQKSLWSTLALNIFHELQRFLFDGITIDVNDLIAIIFAVLILWFFYVRKDKGFLEIRKNCK